jgi:hypothetical protein
MISGRTEHGENELMYDFEDVRRRVGMGRNQTYAAFRRGEIPGQIRFGNGRWYAVKRVFDRAFGKAAA